MTQDIDHHKRLSRLLKLYSDIWHHHLTKKDRNFYVPCSVWSVALQGIILSRKILYDGKSTNIVSKDAWYQYVELAYPRRLLQMQYMRVYRTVILSYQNIDFFKSQFKNIRCKYLHVYSNYCNIHSTISHFARVPSTAQLSQYNLKRTIF